MNELDVKLVYQKEKEKCEEYINKCHLEKINELCINNEIDGVIKHTLIEGENLLALHLLEKNYKNKIDVIYIDPPYNTGSNKLKYKDNFRDKTKGIRHSKWLNMMNERLKLAKKLLSDNGVIFISIDDSEQAYLKVLCDEIFGEENFIANCARRKNKLVMKGDKQFKSVIEYLLVYGKNKNNIEFLYKQKDKTQSDFSVISAGYGKKTITFNPSTLLFNEKEGFIHKGEYKNLTLLDDLILKDNKNKNVVRINAEFKWEEKTLLEKLNKNAYILIKNKENMGMRIYFLNDSSRPLDYIDEKYGKVTNEDGKNDFEVLGIKDNFDYPKPVDFIKFLCSLNCKNDSIVLDFFAGSGTTGQAVMELNEKDGGNRKFILVTNNDNNIATNITRERLYRVINGKGSNGEDFEWEYSKDKKYLKNNAVEYMRIVND